MSKEKLPKAEYSGELHIGDIEIPCHVLEDGTRVLRERSIAKALGKKGGGAYWQKKKTKKGAVLPEYVSAKFLSPYIDDELRIKLLESTTFETQSGSQAQGIDAKLLPEICDIWLKAREKGALSETQQFTAKQAEILMRGFAQIGIIALVDEATGYQEVRARRALEKILEKFIADEFQKWAKTFPDEFYEQLYKLRGWYYYNPDSVKRPSVIGKFTNDLIYERLGPGILDELRRKNPSNSKGRRKQKHHQWLTEDIGHPKLREHIASVITLMKACNNWRNFYSMMQRALPKRNENLELLLETENGEIV